MKRKALSILFAACLALNCFSGAQAGRCEKEQNEKMALPPNLILSRHMKPLVEKVWRRSPTFRHQCDRISQAPWLKVKLKFVPTNSAPGRYRALTVVNKPSGLATVEIYNPQAFVELIGHEFEHVLEQIEGVNLAALTEEKRDQAYRHADGAFETVRALDVGRKVRAEYNRPKRSESGITEIHRGHKWPKEKEKHNDSQNTVLHHHSLASHADRVGKRSAERSDQ